MQSIASSLGRYGGGAPGGAGGRYGGAAGGEVGGFIGKGGDRGVGGGSGGVGGRKGSGGGGGRPLAQMNDSQATYGRPSVWALDRIARIRIMRLTIFVGCFDS